VRIFYRRYHKQSILASVVPAGRFVGLDRIPGCGHEPIEFIELHLLAIGRTIAGLPGRVTIPVLSAQAGLFQGLYENGIMGSHPQPERVFRLMVADVPELRRLIRKILESQKQYEVVEIKAFDAVSMQDASVGLVITNRPKSFLALDMRVLYVASCLDAELGRHCAGVLEKPFTPAEFLQAIEKIFMMI
jgi:hypothetical protein